jgi:aryl-alcohol dehydrogenase-like predicted oxidoreductase
VISPKHLAEALEGSLKRLRLERIDIYQLHAPDDAVSFEASVEALAKLPIVSVQNRYSFADRESGDALIEPESGGLCVLGGLFEC